MGFRKSPYLRKHPGATRATTYLNRTPARRWTSSNVWPATTWTISGRTRDWHQVLWTKMMCSRFVSKPCREHSLPRFSQPNSYGVSMTTQFKLVSSGNPRSESLSRCGSPLLSCFDVMSLKRIIVKWHSARCSDTLLRPRIFRMYGNLVAECTRAAMTIESVFCPILIPLATTDLDSDHHCLWDCQQWTMLIYVWVTFLSPKM